MSTEFNQEAALELARETQSLQRMPAAPPATMGLGVNVENLLAKAVDANSAVEVLERLAIMRREMKAEAGKEAFDRALAEFQAECPVIKKDSGVHDKSGKLRYRYAPLDSIVGQTKELLRRHGFSYSLTARVEDKWVTAVMLAKHEAGHSEQSEFKVPIDPDAYMNAAQKFASALTFAKRYAFCNAFGILTGDWDDDAQASDPDHAAGQDRKAAPPANATRPSQRAEPPRQANTPKTTANAPAANQALAKRPLNGTKPDSNLDIMPSEKFRTRAIEALQAGIGQPGRRLVEDFLRKAGAVLPDVETVENWPLEYVPATADQLAQLRKAVADFENGEEAHMPFIHKTAVELDDKAEKPKPAKKVEAAPTKTAPVEVPRDEEMDPHSPSAPWRSFKVPFGKHAGTELAKVDKRVLYGFWANLVVETEFNGRPRPAEKIAADRLFRAMLDEAGKHYEFEKKD